MSYFLAIFNIFPPLDPLSNLLPRVPSPHIFINLAGESLIKPYIKRLLVMSQDTLEGVPAILYTALWHVREMGFLKRMLDELGIRQLRLLVFFTDYLPGGLLTIDGVAGDYAVLPFQDLAEVADRPYDCAVIGTLEPVVRLLEKGKHVFFGGLGLLIRRKLKVQGLRAILKLAKLFGRCGLNF